MKTYKINELLGEEYREAICNVMWVVNDTFGNSHDANLFFGRDDATIDMLAERLGIRFNEKGDIVR